MPKTRPPGTFSRYLCNFLKQDFRFSYHTLERIFASGLELGPWGCCDKPGDLKHTIYLLTVLEARSPKSVSLGRNRGAKGHTPTNGSGGQPSYLCYLPAAASTPTCRCITPVSGPLATLPSPPLGETSLCLWDGIRITQENPPISRPLPTTTKIPFPHKLTWTGHRCACLVLPGNVPRPQALCLEELISKGSSELGTARSHLRTRSSARVWVHSGLTITIRVHIAKGRPLSKPAPAQWPRGISALPSCRGQCDPSLPHRPPCTRSPWPSVHQLCPEGLSSPLLFSLPPSLHPCSPQWSLLKTLDMGFIHGNQLYHPPPHPCVRPPAGPHSAFLHPRYLPSVSVPGSVRALKVQWQVKQT